MSFFCPRIWEEKGERGKSDMKIVRICNNNIAVVLADDGREMVVFGNGICFNHKKGEKLDESRIEKRFILEDKAVLSKVEELLGQIPEIYFTITEEIVRMIGEQSDLVLSENIYITLMDHICLSLEREKKGIILDNPLLMDIKQIYKKEYALAKKARRIIEKHLDLRVSDQEAGFIALHIVNASMNQQFDVTMRAPKLIQMILEIIRVHFSVEFDEESFHFERFLRHLQFFVKRVLDKRSVQENDTFLYKMSLDAYPDAIACVNKISLFIEMNYKIKVSNAEKGYLAYHIVNVVRERKPEEFND